MSIHLLDNPLITQTLFYPRSDSPSQGYPNIIDGTLPVEDGVVLGYRLYLHLAGQPLIVFFHGNGEIASDYDVIADEFRRSGASLLVVDFRGYGWSTGEPKVSTLLSDVEAVQNALPSLLEPHGLAGSPRYVMGRSLGSAPAIHLAHLYPESFQGIIIESGFAYVLHLLLRRGFAPTILADGIDPIGNVRKIKELNLPLLVIHGENDTLIPVSHGQDLYQASPAAHKQIVRIKGAGHNDLLFIGTRQYFQAIRDLLTH